MSKVRFGISDVVVFKRTEADNTITYGSPMEVKGSVSLSLDPQGDENVFYADNIKYWVGNTNQGYEGTFEVALVPDEFKKLYLGYKLADNGNLVETNAQGESFGMVFKFKLDDEDRYAVLYNCTVSRPSEEHNTIEESATPDTDELTITISGDTVGTVQCYKAEIHAGDSNYATAKTALSLPTFGE